jgi:putative redox protein
MPEKVIVQSLPDYRIAQLLTAEHHSIVADEPEPAGDDLGPSPYELLLWALGACTSMTLLLYARRKGWDVAEVSVHLTHDRVHAEDVDGVEGDGGKVEMVTRDISVRGRLTAEQTERLLQIANRCPVHKTMTYCPKIESTITVGE